MVSILFVYHKLTNCCKTHPCLGQLLITHNISLTTANHNNWRLPFTQNAQQNEMLCIYNNMQNTNELGNREVVSATMTEYIYGRKQGYVLSNKAATGIYFQNVQNALSIQRQRFCTNAPYDLILSSSMWDD